MPDIEAIRRGLAANLAAVPDCQVLPWLHDNPTSAMLQVAGFDEIDYLQSFQFGASLRIVVEGATSLAGGARAAYTRFDRWLLPGDECVQAAIEADDRLTSRLRDNGSVQTGQAPACDALQVREFRGYRRARLPSGVEVLLGDWVVQVEVSEEVPEPPS